MGDEIRNDTEFLSAHWLEEGFPTRRSALYKEWQAAHKEGRFDPLHAVASTINDYLAALGSDRDDHGTTHAHRALVTALGLAPTDRADLTIERDQDLALLQGDRDMEVPALLGVSGPSGTALIVLDARPVDTVEDLLSDGARLVEPVRVADQSGVMRDVPEVAKALSEILVAEDAPRYVVVLAGRWVLLTDAERWSEGRYLGVDLLAVFERRELTSVGGLATLCALVGADVLLPGDDGSIGMDELTKDSTSHAVGVSDDLRDGLRQSIEILAGDVVRTAGERHLDLTDPDLPQRLARESLRFLYRILFLLYAEARPELGIVPVGAPEYAAGYGLDRLRDLIGQPLTTDEERHGAHLHDSLDILFRMVAGDLPSVDVMPVEDLRADLFDRRRTTLIDGDPTDPDPVRLGNAALQQVLTLLLLSKPKRGKRRGYISYANLGINQLGAVYEGLMSYTGILTTEPMVEVAKKGDPSKGSWLVPTREIANYRDEDLVRWSDPVTGEEKVRSYGAGEFAFRLSGRDRERSASFYTPEVLTHCVVEHSLAELLNDGTSAQDILEFRVCEPALGSGAFANEAVNQLAEAYLERRQDELDQRIPADELPEERRRVKAWIALHRVHGVDLNDTAVELAEVSMWLNVMQPKLAAPWFGLHLKRGNSLIGARRATYDLSALRRSKSKWWKTPPEDHGLADLPLGGLEKGDIHHFLLPSDTWGAVAGAKQAKELAPDQVATMKTWKRGMLRQPTATQLKTLASLARRVERLWEIAAKRLEISETEASRDIDVWGRAAEPTHSTVTREQIESALADPDSMYQRLRLVMDAWCALSFWPLDQVDLLPTWEEWLATCTDLLGIEVKDKGLNEDFLTLGNDFDELGEIEKFERSFHRMPTMFEVQGAHQWLSVVQEIAAREGFFHWELDFAQVFQRGGFDLQVGNPPWVRPDWKDDATLAESDPWFMLEDRISVETFRNRRAEVLEDPAVRKRYLMDLTSGMGTVAVLSDSAEHAILKGLRTNLYVNFMERTWRSMSPTGIVGLIHPEGHFLDPKGGVLRENTYRRLRRHWQFDNQLGLFLEIGGTRVFGVNVYGTPHQPQFIQAAGIHIPQTIDDSISMENEGAVPAIKDGEGNWDTRPHPSRILRVDVAVLKTWSLLFDPPRTQAVQARMVRPYLSEHQRILEQFALSKVQFGELEVQVSAGWNEKTSKESGYIVQDKCEPASWFDVILKGPNFWLATPLFQTAGPSGFGKDDYIRWNLETLPSESIPRTNYRRACGRARYDAGMDQWGGRPSWDYWRVAVRSMCDANMERTLIPALIPRGAAHVHARKSPDGDFRNAPTGSPDPLATVLTCGLWSSLPYDFLTKVSGQTHVHPEFIQKLPSPTKHPAWPYLLLRTLRLNCLTRDYEDLWNSLAPLTVVDDAWTPAFSAWPQLTVPTGEWTWDTPLRSDFERRAALVETDALGAIMLGLTAEQLCLIYRVQFGVLRKYEHNMWFDCAGHQIAKDHQAHGVHQEKTDFPSLMDYVAAMEDAGLDAQRDQPSDAIRTDVRFSAFLEHYEAPFHKADREREMMLAHEEFTRRLQAVGLLRADGSEAPGAEDVDAQAVLEGRLTFVPTPGTPCEYSGPTTAAADAQGAPDGSGAGTSTTTGGRV
ncbi:Eco57I restriction-modification methylase domain-containing protein [Actinomyces provencensis]|uniref:Eco57I restriction-modification methylase domain-containing protein n=1 Tax=Actinomyces provencensis TaxID=1720198 RepID=UPI00096A2F37|nr:hypothetical protein [Actinomyces provencensis]